MVRQITEDDTGGRSKQRLIRYEYRHAGEEPEVPSFAVVEGEFEDRKFPRSDE